MSDTPRTDNAAIGFARVLLDKDRGTMAELVESNFARGLERELAAANKRAEEARALAIESVRDLAAVPSGYVCVPESLIDAARRCSLMKMLSVDECIANLNLLDRELAALDSK